MYNILIDKMKVVNSSPVEYYFYFDESWKSVNELIGKKFHFLVGNVFCFCGKKMKKFYRQNFCYDCLELASSVTNVFKPELCQAHLGIEERDLAWEKNFNYNLMLYIFLFQWSKVGVTRKNSVERGGSIQALLKELLSETPNRY